MIRFLSLNVNDNIPVLGVWCNGSYRRVKSDAIPFLAQSLYNGVHLRAGAAQSSALTRRKSRGGTSRKRKDDKAVSAPKPAKTKEKLQTEADSTTIDIAAADNLGPLFFTTSQ
jgi:hypothetical protein